MPEVVRVAALTGYFQVARDLALDPTPLLRAAGLTRAQLLNTEQLIPAEAAIGLLEASAEVTGCETFGLRMAVQRNLADVGVVSLLLAHQPTLRDALSVLALYRHRINSALYLQVDDHDEIVVIREDLSLRSGRASRQGADLALGVLVRICGTVLGPDWHPECACFSYAAPPPSEREVYHQLFRCQLDFGSEFHALVIHAADLDRPNPRAEPAMAAHASNLLLSVMEPGLPTISQEVEQSILLLLPSGRVTISTIANALGMNLRTLQRQLDAEETSFSALLTKVRRQQLARHFANSRLRLTDIAELLGYSSLGAFTRWHSQEFGCSPRAARREGRQKAAVSA